MNVYENDYHPFINKDDNILFWLDLASTHSSKQVQDFLMAHRVQCQQKPSNVPQAHPIEIIWSLLEQKMGSKKIEISWQEG